jgi:hypothetical protein
LVQLGVKYASGSLDVDQYVTEAQQLLEQAEKAEG